jgi:hypothetical protein
VEAEEYVVELKLIDEKFPEMVLGVGGQRVISVAAVRAWNFAKQIIVADLLGPECSIMSGLALAVLDRGSF